ncbi:MAG: Asp-tRNA(Asn)/Glu-tRNA(Gln) amidotransferase subunit GatC [bacterium]|nr:Asp-tRNA(Asn)/Glu-tRNA(Gln) amidotransferase subunit GatC [bacterium]
MNKKVDVTALAKLARLEISDEEVAKLEREISTILSFVETIQKVSVDVSKGDSGLHNVMRDDDHPDEGGIYTEDLLSDAPMKKDNQIVVKQVISRNK